jgi:predicted ribosomally synthesized peptide with nif11-like leader
MSEAQLKAFLEKAKADPALQERLKNASDPSELIAIAKEAGFDVSMESASEFDELSMKELEDVAGGKGGITLCTLGSKSCY